MIASHVTDQCLRERERERERQRDREKLQEIRAKNGYCRTDLLLAVIAFDKQRLVLRHISSPMGKTRTKGGALYLEVLRCTKVDPGHENRIRVKVTRLRMSYVNRSIDVNIHSEYLDK